MFGGDLNRMVILGLLYLQQGLSIGTSGASITLLMKKHYSFSQIGLYFLTFYPNVAKVLWAPIVDSYFWPEFGRRKTWIVPMELISCAMLLYTSFHIETYLSSNAYLIQIIITFTILNFNFSTHDIAVDGLSIEILLARNRSLGATLQFIGLAAGFFLSFTFLMTLTSPEFLSSVMG